MVKDNKRYRSGVYRKAKPLNKTEKAQVKTTVKRMIASRTEKKIFTIDVNGSVSSTPAFNHISVVPQGDADTSRDGDELYLKSVHWSWQMTGSDGTNRIRLVLFQWKEDSAISAPDANDLLQSTTSAGLFGVFRKDMASSYRILYDKILNTDTYANVKSGRKNCYKGFTKKMSFTSGTTDGRHQIFTMVISDSAAATHPQIISQVALRFTDS